MIVKGFIESALDKDHIKVRVPFLNGLKSQVDSTPTNSLADAVVCQMPGVNIQFKTGDVVWIEFENTKWESPVIVGFLDVESKAKSKISYKADDINVEGEAKLPIKTSIGNVTPQSVACLEGLSINLNDYLRKIMPLYHLDLTGYDSGDVIPTSIINDIPDDAMVIATTMLESGSIQYYILIQKTKISQTNFDSSEQIVRGPSYNYVFANALGSVIRISGQVLET